jgi:hypothetical protein
MEKAVSTSWWNQKKEEPPAQPPAPAQPEESEFSLPPAIPQKITKVTKKKGTQ